jgi:hypothetical protein
MTTNTLQTFADYTPLTIASPIDGSAITIYNVSNAARTRTLNLNTNAGPDDKKWTNAVEFSGSGRLKGAQIFGGISADRTRPSRVVTRRIRTCCGSAISRLKAFPG